MSRLRQLPSCRRSAAIMLGRAIARRAVNPATPRRPSRSASIPQSGKPPADAVHAVLLANDQAAAAAAQFAGASGNRNAEPAIPIAALAVEIAARAQAGQNRFEIRLDPPELGRIDVRLDIDRSGQVTSRLIVDRPETLDHLRRDSAGLQRALQDAGMKTAQNGLQFSLRDQGFARRNSSNPSSDAARLVVPDPDLAPRRNTHQRLWRTCCGPAASTFACEDRPWPRAASC